MDVGVKENLNETEKIIELSDEQFRKIFKYMFVPRLGEIELQAIFSDKRINADDVSKAFKNHIAKLHGNVRYNEALNIQLIYIINYLLREKGLKDGESFELEQDKLDELMKQFEPPFLPIIDADWFKIKLPNTINEN